MYKMLQEIKSIYAMLYLRESLKKQNKKIFELHFEGWKPGERLKTLYFREGKKHKLKLKGRSET